jgi:hypothetical protein
MADITSLIPMGQPGYQSVTSNLLPNTPASLSPTIDNVGQVTNFIGLPSLPSAASVTSSSTWSSISAWGSDALSSGKNFVKKAVGPLYPDGNAKGTAGVGLAAPVGDTRQIKVKLKSAVTGYYVVFDILPLFDDNGSAQYSDTNILHMPSQMVTYKFSDPKSISLEFTLVSRNEAEAKKNFRYMSLIKSWTKPRFGDKTQDNLGAPPDILYLSGLGDIFSSQGFTNTNNPNQDLPVVLLNYAFHFNAVDTDWISTGPADDARYAEDNAMTSTEGRFEVYDPTAVPGANFNFKDFQPIPIILKGSITLKEAFSPKEISSFNIDEFTVGLSSTLTAQTNKKLAIANAQKATADAALAAKKAAETNKQKPTTPAQAVANPVKTAVSPAPVAAAVPPQAAPASQPVAKSPDATPAQPAPTVTPTAPPQNLPRGAHDKAVATDGSGTTIADQRKALAADSTADRTALLGK